MISVFRENAMHFRSILGGALAVLLVAAIPSEARETTRTSPMPDARGMPAPLFNLPGIFGARREAPEIRLAQATSDPRVIALEEQVRSLSGTLEELNFQILQLQEQIRKIQEDNEFRFQELEKRSDARVPGKERTVAGDAAKPRDAARQAEPNTPASVEDVIVNDQTAPAGDTAAQGEPPKTFGTITFDAAGNVTGGDAGAQDSAATAPASPDADGTVVAALPTSDDPEELYRNAYQFILSGDYATAETGFRDHIARYPENARAPDSHFWLGESLLGQKKYRDAAEVFLAANKDYPKSKKAPDMLLKLGIALVGLNQRDVACATFGEVSKRYPEASVALKDRVKQERALATC
jgi:tol-pal system protein YbgF